MAAITVQQKAYQETSTQPIPSFDIYEPVIATGVAVGSIAMTAFSFLYGPGAYLP